jgi:hypothetical protein
MAPVTADPIGHGIGISPEHGFGYVFLLQVIILHNGFLIHL